MQLNKFQNQFKDLMLDHPDALNSPPKDLAAFCKSGDIALPTRLKVYRNNVVGSLTDIMLATFPTLDKLVGRQFFEMMARDFILNNPPTQGCLSLYGAGFAEFIEEFELAKSLPYLADIARYEIALNQAYYAADDRALAPEDLGAIAPEKLDEIYLELRSSAQLLSSKFPLSVIQAFCAKDDGQGQLNIDQGGEFLLVYRPHLDTETVLLEEDTFFMLCQLSENKPLGEAVSNTLQTFKNFDFQAFLQKHLALETFKALDTNS